MSDPDGGARDWGSCPTCGDALGPRWTKCPSCDEQFPHGKIPAPTPPRRRRSVLLSVLRVAIVVGIVAGIAIAIIQPTLSGPPVLADPLTTAGAYAIGPGNSSALSGAITGEDYIEGNFTVVNPQGASVSLSVYNSSEYDAFVAHGAAVPAQITPASPSGIIVFGAPYTDTFYFVFTNPYPAASGIGVHVYIVTNYESNVVIG